jgi:hypothetical protein
VLMGCFQPGPLNMGRPNLPRGPSLRRRGRGRGGGGALPRCGGPILGVVEGGGSPERALHDGTSLAGGEQQR